MKRVKMLGRKLKIKQLSNYMPAYAHTGDAGLDLRTTEDITLRAGQHKTVGTGIAVEIPDGCVGLLFPRSGLACKHGVALRNCVGVIDSGYRGEIKVTLTNFGSISQRVHRGDRIAQLVVVPYVHCRMQLVDELDDTERGEDGYGSTGR